MLSEKKTQRQLSEWGLAEEVVQATKDQWLDPGKDTWKGCASMSRTSVKIEILHLAGQITPCRSKDNLQLQLLEFLFMNYAALYYVLQARLKSVYHLSNVKGTWVNSKISCVYRALSFCLLSLIFPRKTNSVSLSIFYFYFLTKEPAKLSTKLSQSFSRSLMLLLTGRISWIEKIICCFPKALSCFARVLLIYISHFQFSTPKPKISEEIAMSPHSAGSIY